MELFTKKYEITAPAEIHDRLDAFLAFFHFNGGHSGTFGMWFDGDGADTLKVDPPPPKEYAKGSQRIANAGHELEIATNQGTYYSRALDRKRPEYRYKDGALWKLLPGQHEDWKLVDDFERFAKL